MKRFEQAEYFDVRYFAGHKTPARGRYMSEGR